MSTLHSAYEKFASETSQCNSVGPSFKSNDISTKPLYHYYISCPHVIFPEGRTKFNLMRSCGVVARYMNILRLSLDCRCLFCLGYLHSNAFMLVKNHALTLVKIYHEVPERRDDKQHSILLSLHLSNFTTSSELRALTAFQTKLPRWRHIQFY